MKDRQFMVILGLVVAAGLVMGLIAFRVSGGSPVPMAAAGNAVASNGGARAASPDDGIADASGETPASTEPVDLQNGEPTRPATEPPEMQGPANGDPPGTAASEPSQPAVSTEVSGDTIQ